MNMSRVLLVFLIMGIVFSHAQDWTSDYDVFTSQQVDPTISTATVKVQERGYNFTVAVHVAVMKGKSTAFSIISNGCFNHTVLSNMAKESGCTYATNGGFFNTNGAGCVGNVIIDKKWLSNVTTLVPSIGVRSSDKAYVLGHINQADIKHMGFDYLLSGMVWLVRKGVSYVNISSVVEGSGTAFLAEKAPRTAVGVDKEGNLYLIQVDGQENIYKGMDLYEFSDFIVSLGVWSAVNIDGGGSSESYYNGKVISSPTSYDNSTIAERPLGTGTCLTIG
jgi:N-acetylglucosamine-1-phosphodiester alpha-N-acetylglucosaminidase